jgi:hypothetical protein
MMEMRIGWRRRMEFCGWMRLMMMMMMVMNDTPFILGERANREERKCKEIGLHCVHDHLVFQNNK